MGACAAEAVDVEPACRGPALVQGVPAPHRRQLNCRGPATGGRLAPACSLTTLQTAPLLPTLAPATLTPVASLRTPWPGLGGGTLRNSAELCGTPHPPTPPPPRSPTWTARGCASWGTRPLRRPTWRSGTPSSSSYAHWPAQRRGGTAWGRQGVGERRRHLPCGWIA